MAQSAARQKSAPKEQSLTGAGILPGQAIQRLIGDGAISAEAPIPGDQIQPASMDLRLGATAYRVRASFLPGEGASVAEKIQGFAMHRIDLTEDAVLEKGCVYIVPLMESLNLAPELSGMANPKSSTGRLDIFTRLITDGSSEFDRIRAGYVGPLHAEISPRTFSVLVRQGLRLSQLRLRQGEASVSDAAMQALHDSAGLVQGAAGNAHIDNGIAISADLIGGGRGTVIGYRAKRHTGVVDLERINHYEIHDFWEPISNLGEGRIILDPDEFYILASKEAVNVPPEYAAEMRAYDTLVGEFRVHYAGFFDPGFGYRGAGGGGSRAVLEVRSHDVPFVLEDGQRVG
ncbi:MAG: 2'-deoxycytidine 5'-triphosphate deaminase, partial [Rhodospirillales bacterium]|nr:2'-deoxycytidine 5'-triphosphate deaminase [Rhodospirillales bacterium]